MTYQSHRKDTLERKLQLLLGTGSDWLEKYSRWLVENGCGAEQGHDDHNINLFVRQQRERKNG